MTNDVNSPTPVASDFELGAIKTVNNYFKSVNVFV